MTNERTNQNKIIKKIYIYILFIILKYCYTKSPWSDSDSLSCLLFSLCSECDTLFTLQCSFQWREREGWQNRTILYWKSNRQKPKQKNPFYCVSFSLSFHNIPLSNRIKYFTRFKEHQKRKKNVIIFQTSRNIKRSTCSSLLFCAFITNFLASLNPILMWVLGF